MLRYLFLCAMGENRSPTAVKVAYEIAEKKGLDIEASYGGIDNLSMDKDDSEELGEYFNKFDMIIVMEGYMKRIVLNHGFPKRRIRCLHIPDCNLREPGVEEKLRGTLKNCLNEAIRENPWDF